MALCCLNGFENEGPLRLVGGYSYPEEAKAQSILTEPEGRLGLVGPQKPRAPHSVRSAKPGDNLMGGFRVDYQFQRVGFGYYGRRAIFFIAAEEGGQSNGQGEISEPENRFCHFGQWIEC